MFFNQTETSSYIISTNKNLVYLFYNSGLNKEPFKWDFFKTPFKTLLTKEEVIKKSLKHFCSTTGCTQDSISFKRFFPAKVSGYCLDCGFNTLEDKITDENVEFFCEQCFSKEVKISSVKYFLQIEVKSPLILSLNMDSEIFLDVQGIEQKDLKFQTPYTEEVDFVLNKNKNRIVIDSSKSKDK